MDDLAMANDGRPRTMEGAANVSHESKVREAVRQSHESAVYYFDYYFREAAALRVLRERERGNANDWRKWAVWWFAMTLVSTAAMWFEIARHAK